MQAFAALQASPTTHVLPQGAARGLVGECGHLVARDAAEGVCRAKKRHFGRASAGTFLLRLGLVVKTAHFSDVTGP
jgi:hypothetical protein